MADGLVSSFSSFAPSCFSTLSGAVTQGPSLKGLLGAGLAIAIWGVSPMPMSTADGIAAMAIALPAGTWSRVSSGFFGAACLGPVLAPAAALLVQLVTRHGASRSFRWSGSFLTGRPVPSRPGDPLRKPAGSASTDRSARLGTGRLTGVARLVAGAHETPSAPPISPRRKPIRKAPKFETTRETRESRIAATPAKHAGGGLEPHGQTEHDQQYADDQRAGAGGGRHADGQGTDREIRVRDVHDREAGQQSQQSAPVRAVSAPLPERNPLPADGLDQPWSRVGAHVVQLLGTGKSVVLSWVRSCAPGVRARGTADSPYSSRPRPHAQCVSSTRSCPC